MNQEPKMVNDLLKEAEREFDEISIGMPDGVKAEVLSFLTEKMRLAARQTPPVLGANTCYDPSCTCHQPNGEGYGCTCEDNESGCLVHNGGYPEKKPNGEGWARELEIKLNSIYLHDGEHTIAETFDSIRTLLSHQAKDIVENLNVGMLRQWLNEDRKCTPMVTNEDIIYWINQARKGTEMKIVPPHPSTLLTKDS